MEAQYKLERQSKLFPSYILSLEELYHLASLYENCDNNNAKNMTFTTCQPLLFVLDMDKINDST